MSTILFSNVIFGPVKSRRLGTSLGINLLPVDGKLCSFDCIYCECGYNSDGKTQSELPARNFVRESLEKKLQAMKEKQEELDTITFAGNGEPTLNPDFDTIIDDTIELRNKYFPYSKISVFSNATMIWKDKIFQALNKIDNNILKLDSVLNEKMRLIDQPNNTSITISILIDQLKRFKGNLIIQTMFIQGIHNGRVIDNTSDEEIDLWIEKLNEIKPKKVMIYTIDRETPSNGICKVPLSKLNAIADKLKHLGFETSVSA